MIHVITTTVWVVRMDLVLMKTGSPLDIVNIWLDLRGVHLLIYQPVDSAEL